MKILWVHKSIAEDFLKLFNEAVKTLKFGMPWEKDVALTPLPEPHKIEYLNNCIADAQMHGARVVNDNGGRFVGSFFTQLSYTR